MTAHPRRRQILAVLCLSLLIVVIDNTVLNTALPTLARDLGAGTTDLQWIVDAYTLAFAALLIPAGTLGDRLGRRGGLLAGLTVFGAGSVAAALATGVGSLIAARTAMGVGAAAVMPATLSILTTVFPPEERPGAIAAWSAMAGVGVVLGPVLGGALLVSFDWSSVFWINVPLVLAAFVLVAAVVPSVRPERVSGSRLDVAGALLAALALLALTFSVIEAPVRGWLSAETLGVAAAGLALLAAFVVRELRTPWPLIDVRVFANAAFSAASGSVAVVFFALFGSLFALTQYLQVVKGYSALTAGVSALPFAGMMLVAAPLSAVLAGRFGARVVIPAGLSLMGGGLLFVALVAAPDTPYALLAVGVATMGAGLGLTLAPAGESILGSLPPERAGVGSAVNDTVQELGGTLGVAVIGSLVAALYRGGIDDAGFPAAIGTPARSSVAAADAVAAQAGPAGQRLVLLAHDAFTSAMTTGFLVAAAVAFAGAVLAAVCLPARAENVFRLPSLASS